MAVQKSGRKPHEYLLHSNDSKAGAVLVPHSKSLKTGERRIAPSGLPFQNVSISAVDFPRRASREKLNRGRHDQLTTSIESPTTESRSAPSTTETQTSGQGRSGRRQGLAADIYNRAAIGGVYRPHPSPLRPVPSRSERMFDSWPRRIGISRKWSVKEIPRRSLLPVERLSDQSSGPAGTGRVRARRYSVGPAYLMG